MPTIRRQRAWATKPPYRTPVNWGNPYAAGLLSCCPMAEGSGRQTLDVLTGQQCAFNSFDGTHYLAWVPATWGYGTTGGTYTEGFNTGGFSFSNSGVTIGALVYITSFSGQPLFSTRSLYSSNLYGIVTSGSNALTVYWGYAASGNMSGTTGAVVATNQWYWVILTGSQSACKCFVNGIQVLSLTGGSLAQASPTGMQWNYDNGAGYGNTGLGFTAIWNYRMPDPVIASMGSQPPWQIFAPQPGQWLFKLGVAGTFTPPFPLTQPIYTRNLFY